MGLPKLDPQTGQMAFKLALFFLFASLVIMPFIKDEATRIINIFTIIISAIFLTLVIYMVRKK